MGKLLLNAYFEALNKVAYIQVYVTVHELRVMALQVTDTVCRLFLVGASFTQGTISSIPVGGSISPKGFLLLVLLLVEIIVTVVIVIVILIVVVGDDVSLIVKLLFKFMSDSDEPRVTHTDDLQSDKDLSDIGSPRADDHEFPDAPPSPEDQPYAEDASPIAQSPDYVPESDPEADPEEDGDEDPEEDPIDYPADGGDDGDD
ncbi:hypothetical protein Tco_0490662 [Tanacetum coccineum]